MKNITYFLCCSLLSISLFSQEIKGDFSYKATYEITYQIDSSNVDSKKSETTLLYVGDEISRFSSLGTTIADSLSMTVDKSNKSMAEFSRIRSMTPKTDFNYKVFKHYDTNKLQFVEKVFKDKIKYEESLNGQEWMISPETDTILGYAVQKASTSFAGRDYIAWFTPEIPISDGPYKFNGLPGLILQISDIKEEYQFKLTGFQKLSKPVSVVIDYEKYRNIPKEDFLKIKENFKRDPLSAMSNAGVKIGWSKEDERNAKKELDEKFKKENNPLELE